MNKYVCMYRGKELVVEADTTYKAQLLASQMLKAKRSYEVSVYLVEHNGKEYVHSTASI
jgi:hypothetical protein